MQNVTPAPSVTKKRGLVTVKADASTQDAKTLLISVQAAVKELRETSEQQQAEIKAQVKDCVTTEKLDRVNTTISELQGALDKLATQQAHASLGTPETAPVDAEYTAAFNDMMVSGVEASGLNRSTGEQGGFLAPSEWDRTIVSQLQEVSPMRQHATVINTDRGEFKKLFNVGGTAAGWVGETDVREPTENAKFKELLFTAHELYAMPAVTQSLLDDSAIDLEKFIADEVEMAFAEQEGFAFIGGDGAKKPNGFLSYASGATNATLHPAGALKTVETAASDALTYDELLTLVYDLPARYRMNAKFMMNSNALSKVRTLKDNEGRYIWQPSGAEGQPQKLAGYGVAEAAEMPDVEAGTTPLAFGDFKRGYLIVDRKGISVLRDPFSKKPYVLFYITKRVGGGVIDPKAINVMKMKP
ncbi:phage major capsid protein [Flexibacterium corallicola]|uniref:phage major capsid protein n=1 Tax=Flexibacterium corallicola TaxID=3037259 RepID=UPI00286ECF98|nr:phage major capsid protein [Pseudovibrio sp. M1P-2-3]